MEHAETYEELTGLISPEPKKLMVAGDWHHNYRWAAKMLYRAHERGVDTVLQLGDFGYWPLRSSGENGFVNGIAHELRRYGMRLFWVDGNHEDHRTLTPGSGSEVIRHLPRGYRWQWWGKTWMALGGGVSVDKDWRTPGVDWFPEETLTPDQFEFATREGGVDIIVSHDCPKGVRIPGVHAMDKQGPLEEGECESCGMVGTHKFSCSKDRGGFPAHAIADSESHRGLLAEVGKATNPAYWFHGHYHSNYQSVWRHPDWREDSPGVLVRGLGMDGTSFMENCMIVTAEDFEAVSQ